jgi:predicted phage tail protein
LVVLRGMAHRVGLWTLYTGRMESDVITFQTGIDSAFLVPGDVILIHDKFARRRNSGRVVASTANSITGLYGRHDQGWHHHLH